MYMKWLRQDVDAHRLAAALTLACWLAVLVITLATWVFDTTGSPIGMHPVAILLNLFLPFGASALVGWWRLTPPTSLWRIGPSIRAGLLAGMLIVEIDLVGETSLWMLLYRLILGRPLAQSVEALEGVVEFVSFALLSAIIGLLLGMMGGLAGGLLAVVLGYVRGRGRQGGLAGSP